MKLLPAAVAAIALASALSAPPVQAQQAAAPAASAASAPAFGVRAEVANPLNVAIDLFRSGKVADALVQVDKVIATVAQPTPAETTTLARIRGQMLLQLDRPADAVKSFEAALATNAQRPEDRLSCEEGLARASFTLKDYPAAVQWSRKAIEHGSKSGTLHAVLVRSLYLGNDHAGVVKLLEAQDKSAALNVDDLRMLASSYGQIKDDTSYVRLTERLLRDHGRTEYWPDLLARVQRAESWQTRWDIDAYRLRMQLDLMDEADDYLVLADLAAKAGLPAEAQKVLDAGLAKGLLGKGAKAADHQKFRAAMAKAAAEDRAALTAAMARAPAVADARSATNTFNTGLALVSNGQPERGLALMQAALGGPLPDAAQARLQYAQALHAGGRAADAQEQLKTLSTHPQLGLLARLWAQALSPRKPG